MTTRFSLLAALTGLAVVASISPVRAQTIIGIDMYNGSQTNQTPGTAAVVGPVPTSGWYNEVNPAAVPGPASLVNNLDQSTSATFGFTQSGNTLSGNPIYNSGYGAAGAANATLTANQQLYNGSVQASYNSWSQQLVLTNIPYGQYDVYLLVYAGQYTNTVGSVELFKGGVLSGASTTYYFSNTGPYNVPPIPDSTNNPFYVVATGTSFATATSGADVVHFGDIFTPNSTFDLVNDGGTVPESIDLAGIEIVATPEPSTWALMLAGVVMLAVLARRRRLAVRA